MTPYETLLYTVDGGVATLVLNRPASLNAINPLMADELAHVLRQADGDDGVRALVLRGAGDAFCAGGDMRVTSATGPRTEAQAREGMARYSRLTLALYKLDKPVIAAVDGVAYGAGFSLALLADIVLLSARARLCMAFQRVGLVPDCGALFTLPRAVGLQRAKELMLSGRQIDAAQALAMGIALEVLPPEELHARARQMAEAFCGASAATLAMTKRALNASMQSDMEAMLEMEASGQAIALAGEYAREASRRFAAKEPARFRWP